jgi:type II secretory pathway pseudopilin PulG
MRRLRGEDGVGIVELVVTMVLLGIIGTATTSIVVSSIRVERVTDDLRTNLDEARVAAERMRRDVREARRIYVTSPEGLTSGSSQIAFWRDTNQDQLQQTSEQVTYRFAAEPDGSGRLERRVATDPAGEWRVIARRLDLSDDGTGKARSRFDLSPVPPKTSGVTMVLTVKARPSAGASAKTLSISETVRLRNAS